MPKPRFTPHLRPSSSPAAVRQARMLDPSAQKFAAKLGLLRLRTSRERAETAISSILPRFRQSSSLTFPQVAAIMKSPFRQLMIRNGRNRSPALALVLREARRAFGGAYVPRPGLKPPSLPRKRESRTSRGLDSRFRGNDAHKDAEQDTAR